MQLTVQNPEVREETVVLTLRLDPNTDLKCSLCNQRPPEWFDDPAAPTAMNPTISPVGGPDACSSCLNMLLETGTLEVIDVDPSSF